MSLITKLISNFPNKITKTSTTINKMACDNLRPLSKDVFEKTVKKFPNFMCDTADSTMPDFQKIMDNRHLKRMEKFGSTLVEPPRRVSKKEWEAIYKMQFEMGEYTGAIEKLKNHIPLSPKESEFISSIISQMQPTKENRVLWRSTGIYDGFEEQIKNGTLNLDSLTSTSSKYDDFFEFWKPSSMVKKGDKLIKKEGYILKFNVPKGTSVLDCNVKCGKKGTRMRSEVILPPSKWAVESIDNDLKVIELSPLKS